jgi:NAD(P) transhydrogenase subunit beta
MNVLLAEANVPYPQLKEMDEANPEFGRTDVALVVGANDVVNPDARNNQGSPIYGMPILNVDEAETVVVLKRSMNPGFAGIENPLFFNPKTVMLFGDAKASIVQLVQDVKGLCQLGPGPFFAARHVGAAVSPEKALEAVRDAFVAQAG